MLAAQVFDSLRYCKNLDETREVVMEFIEDVSVPKREKFVELAGMARVGTGFFLNASRTFHRNLLNDCYEKMFDETGTPSENIPCFQWFLQCDSRLDLKPNLERRFAVYFENRLPTCHFQDCSNLLDIFKTERPGLIAMKRAISDRFGVFNNIGRRKQFYYNDPESVHNSGVQLSFKQAVEKLDSTTSEDFAIVVKEIKTICSSPKQISSLERIEIDASDLNIASLLCKVWKRIKCSEHRSELVTRLRQELEEMNGKCSSGIATRIVNVLSGFDGEVGIKINIADEIRAIWNFRLQNFLQADEAMMEDFINQTDSFCLWMKGFKENFFQDMKKDYANLFDESFTVDVLVKLIENL